MFGPKKIICLTEEPTELLYLLGESERIIGISAYTERPPIAKLEKPKVSAFIKGNVNKIEKLKPDLVVGFSDIQGQLAKDLIERGLNVLIFNQRSIMEIFEAMMILGGIVGKNKETATLIENWKNSIEEFKMKSKLFERRPKVFFQEWDEPIITGIKWVSEAISIAGGEDAFGNLQNEKLAKNRIVTAEAVAQTNPDIILGSWCGKPMDWEWVRNKLEWQNTSAILKGNIFEIDPSIILQPGPALFIEGIPKLHEIFSSVTK
ncbi:MAG: cobalamin-binding protein [Leptospira sp.]|nr:cobalamin-binding protein [Leptospira sp.]